MVGVATSRNNIYFRQIALQASFSATECANSIGCAATDRLIVVTAPMKSTAVSSRYIHKFSVYQFLLQVILVQRLICGRVLRIIDAF